MTPKKLFIIAAIGWFSCAPLTFGIMNAHFRGDFPTLFHDPREAREQCGASAGVALLGPISLTVAIFSSGFAYDGLSYSCAPVKNDEQWPNPYQKAPT